MLGGMRRGERGASAVEFALVLPLLVLFLFGILQFGIAFTRTQGMEAAAREGARVASLGRNVTQQDVVDAVHASRPPFVQSDSDLAVTIQPSSSNWCSEAGNDVTVRVQIVSGDDYYRLAIPFWGDSAPTYQAEGTFRCERPHTGAS